MTVRMPKTKVAAKATVTSYEVKTEARAAGDNVSRLVEQLVSELGRDDVRKDVTLFLMQRIHRRIGLRLRGAVMEDAALRKRLAKLKGLEFIRALYAAGM